MLNNNKGYMLIEVILASVMAIGVAAFLAGITIKLKNKNDDLLVKSLVSTDQGIIYNTIMEDVYDNDLSASQVCTKLSVYYDNEGCKCYKVEYDNVVTAVSEYAKVGTLKCDEGKKLIVIPIGVEQLPDENFDIVIKLNK